MLFAYFGPETLLPITSVIAGVVGVLMVLGKNTFRFLGLIWSGLWRMVRPNEPSVPAPHITPTPTGTGNALERRRAKARTAQETEARDEHGR